jgi:hypothetical protein
VTDVGIRLNRAKDFNTRGEIRALGTKERLLPSLGHEMTAFIQAHEV